jgi:hypothetical protein
MGLRERAIYGMEDVGRRRKRRGEREKQTVIQ